MAKHSGQHKGNKCKRCCKACGHCLRANCKLTIANYFGVSGFIYVICSFVVNVQYGKIKHFLCDVWAGRNETGNFGKGCLNCGFDNIFCDATPCWHDAINLTYQDTLVNRTPGFVMEVLLKAPTKVESATFKDASIDIACNDVLRAKTTPVEAVLQMAKQAVESQDDARVPAVTAACQQFHCEVVRNALEHPDLMKAPMSDAPIGCSDIKKVKRSWARDVCVCAGLYQTMSVDDMTTLQNYCSFTLQTTQTTTTITTTTTNTDTTTTSIDGSERRLASPLVSQSHPLHEQDRLYAVRDEARPIVNPYLLPQANRNCGGRARSANQVESTVDAHAQMMQADGVDAVVDLADDLFASVPMRALQTAPAPPPAGLTNDDFDDYETGEFSKCMCYQQCVSGVKTRSVKCLSARCKEPKPAALQSCTCPHCADCSILLNLDVFFWLFLVQGGVALFVWANFLWLGSQSEANFVHVGWIKWFLGIWVKQLPGSVRLCVLMNIFQIVIMLIQTWTPESLFTITPDCHASMDLRVLSIILLGVLVTQITMGIVTRLTNRMPPFLFRPLRPSHILPIKILGGISRFLGP